MTQDKCYHRTKPLPIYSPCDHLPSNDIPYLSPSSSPSSSTSDSTCSSTSDSTCSSPSSSSSSFCWDPEGRERKRIQVRDSGRGRGRGRGRGGPRKMLQVGQRGSSRGKIQAARRWGRPSKTDKIGEESQIDEDQVDVRVVKSKTINLEEHAQVTEDLNEVMGLEIEQGVIRGGAEKQQNQSENNNNAVVGTWLSVEDQTDVSEEEDLPCEQLTVGEKYRLQKDYNVRWIGRLEHIHRKGECVKQRGSGSRQHARNEQRQPCEQFVERTKEQDHQRKQCNVIWIGRRVRKLKEAARDPFEEQSDDDVTGPEDNLNDAEVDELVEQSQQKIETEETNAEHNRTEENQQSDIVEKHNFGEEQVTTVPYEGHNRVGMEPVLEVQMAYEQDSVMMQCEVEATVANVGKQLADTVEGQNRSKEQPKKGNKGECQPHEQLIGGDTEQKILEKQVEIKTAEDNEADEQTDYLTEEQGETKGQSSEPRDDITEVLIYPQEQCVEMPEDYLQPFGEDQLMNKKAELAEELQTALPQKEIDSEVQHEQYSHMIEEKNQPRIEKDGLQDENNIVGNENMASLGGIVDRVVRKLKEAAKDPFEEQPDDEVIGLEDDFSDAEADEHVEQLKQEIEKEGTNAEQNQTEENQQSDMAEKQILREGRVTSVIDDKNLQCQGHDRVVMEPVLEVQMAGEQDSVITQYEAEVTVASVGRPLDDTVEVQNRPEEQLKKGKEEELQTHEQQKGGDTEQKILEKQVEIESAKYTEADEQNYYLTEEQEETIEQSSEQPQQEEPQTKVNEKEYMLVVDSERRQEQGVEMIEDQNQPCVEKDVLQDNLVGMEPVLEVQMADEQESVIMQYEAQGAVASVETAEKTKAEEQNNYLTVEHDETKGHSAELHDDIMKELIYPQEQCIEMAAISLQSCEEDQLKIGEAEITEERSQEEEQQTKVIRKEMDSEVQEEQCFDMIEEKDQQCIVKDVLQDDKDAASSENIASSGSTIEGSRAFSCNSSDHKLQEEPRQPLRQGLRSSCKNKEATSTEKNQLEDVTPVRRVLRSHKSVSEAAKINEVPDHSKEQLEHSERTRSSKRKSIIPEAEPVSNLRRTRRTGL